MGGPARPVTRTLPPAVRKYFIPGLVCAALIAGGIWYLQQLRDPARTLEAALAAIRAEDRHEAERLASLLSQRGHPDFAAFIRAKQQHHHVERLVESSIRLVRQEEQERAARLCVQPASVFVSGLAPMPVMLAGDVGTPAISVRLDPRRQERTRLDEQIVSACLAAHEHVRAIAPESPLRVEGAIIAAECLFRLGDVRGSAAAWSFVAERRPDHVEAHRRLAVVFYDTGAVQQAIHHLEQVARLEPEDGRPHRQIGLIMKEDKQSRLAIAAYREALRRKLSPAARADVVQELAEIWLGEGEADYKEALATLKQCPAECASRSELIALRAEAMWKARIDEPEALKLVERALRQNADLVSALLLRARMFAEAEQPHAAVPLLERAVRWTPHDLRIRTELAGAYARLAAELGAAAPLEMASYGILHGLGAPLVVPDVTASVQQCLVQPQALQAASLRDEMKSQIEELSRLSRKAMEAMWDDQVRCDIAKLWLKMDNRPLARTWLQAALTCNPHNQEASRLLRESAR